PATTLFRSLVAGDVAALLVAELDARCPRQVLDGFDEAQVFDLLDEGDDVAAFPAAEAVPEVACGGDVERGGLLVVERAQAFEGAAAGVAQLEVFADHVGDRGTLPYQCDVFIFDSTGHGSQGIRCGRARVGWGWKPCCGRGPCRAPAHSRCFGQGCNDRFLGRGLAAAAQPRSAEASVPGE